MSEPRSEGHRAQSLGAWKAAMRSAGALNPDHGFNVWYDETYPPPPPPEPPIGSVRGSDGSGAVWVRGFTGGWQRSGVASLGFPWAHAISNGLDPSRIFAEIPDPDAIDLSSNLYRAVLGPVPHGACALAAIRATLTGLRKTC